jgi:hypothetical protein
MIIKFTNVGYILSLLLLSEVITSSSVRVYYIWILAITKILSQSLANEHDREIKVPKLV